MRWQPIEYMKLIPFRASYVPMAWAQGVGRSNRPAPTNLLCCPLLFRETAHLPKVQGAGEPARSQAPSEGGRHYGTDGRNGCVFAQGGEYLGTESEIISDHHEMVELD